MGHCNLVVAYFDAFHGERFGVKRVQARFQNDLLHPALTGLGKLRLGRFTGTRGDDADVAGINLDHFLHADFIGVWIQTVSARQKYFTLDATFANARRHAGRDTGYASARMATWWEIDPTYYVMRVLSALRIIDMTGAQKIRYPAERAVPAT